MAIGRKENLDERAPRIRGICADAAALGITRDHLRLVLQAKRPSRSLLRRYRQLKRAQRAAETTKSKI